MLTALLLALSASPLIGQAPEVEVGSIPDWVDVAAVPRLDGVPVDQISNGLYSLLHDTQERIHEGELTLYADIVWHVHDTSGVQNGSQVAIDFDPSYQSLVLHTIEVHRGDEVVDRLDLDAVQILQREEELASQLYDGVRTALLFLPDVRPGDRVRQAYSLHGSNPALAGHHTRMIWLATSWPMHRIRYRLLWPADRRLTVRAHAAAPAPDITEHDGYRDYRWEAQAVPAIAISDPLPGWYLAFPWVQLTDFADWNAVARWGVEQYPAPEALGGELEALVASFREQHDAPEDRALAALRFVQDEVRYLGIELGTGAYRATPPAEVLARRFGDCKDKSLLLATVLRALDIPARVGFVSTALTHTIGTYAPSPSLFDHVIVRIDLPAGPYWVDPTEALIGGDLRAHQPPAYGRALVVDSATEAPEPIGNVGEPALTRITYAIDAREVGAPARLDVETEYRGRSADNFRSHYATLTAERYSQACLEYYSALYPTATARTRTAVADDRDANVVRTTEHYEIPGLWEEDEGQAWTEFYPLEIAGVLPALSAGPRDHPLGLGHPVRYEQSIAVQLSDVWAFEPESEVIDNPAFRFTYDVAFDEHTHELRLGYSFHSKSDSVAPEAVEAVIGDFHRARELLSYSILSGGDGSLDWGWLAAGGAAVALALLACAALIGAAAVRSRQLCRDRTFDEIVDDVRDENPFLTIWTRPRATLRAILDTDPTRLVVALAAIAGILQVLDRASSRGMGDEQALGFILGGALVGGLIGGVLQLYVSGWVLQLSGRILGGSARAVEVRAAYAWAQVVPLGFGLLWIPYLLLYREEMFTTEMPRTDASAPLSATLIALGVIETVGVVWAFVVFLKCLGEAHRFSAWKALGAVALALAVLALGLVVVAIALPFLVLAS